MAAAMSSWIQYRWKLAEPARNAMPAKTGRGHSGRILYRGFEIGNQEIWSIQILINI
jgi:hypothetical protein